jgi:N-acetylmuramoyl-L-alanine amidase
MRKPIIIAATLTLLVLLASVPAHSQDGPLSGHKICLDPGHGGSDPGAVYAGGSIYLEEADINLDVSHSLKALLQRSGAEVVMTRRGDSDATNRDRYTFCNSEQATILVSVHTNSSTDPEMDGSMALYFHKDDEALTQAIYDVMYPLLRDTAPEGTDFVGFGLDKFASGVLLKSDMPSAMMEPLFMSNPDEAELLVDPIYPDDGSGPDWTSRRGQIAQAIHDGIVAYVESGGSDGGDDDGGGGGPPCGSPPCGKDK